MSAEPEKDDPVLSIPFTLGRMYTVLEYGGSPLEELLGSYRGEVTSSVKDANPGFSQMTLQGDNPIDFPLTSEDPKSNKGELRWDRSEGDPCRDRFPK